MTLHWAEINNQNQNNINLTDNLYQKYNIPDMSPFRDCENCSLNNSNCLNNLNNLNNCNSRNTQPIAANSISQSPLTDIINTYISKPFYENHIDNNLENNIEKNIFPNDKISQYTFDINSPLNNQDYDSEKIYINKKKTDNLPINKEIYNNKEIDLPIPYVKKNYSKYNTLNVNNIRIKQKPSVLSLTDISLPEDNSNDIKWMGILYLFILSFVILSIN